MREHIVSRMNASLMERGKARAEKDVIAGEMRPPDPACIGCLVYQKIECEQRMRNCRRPWEESCRRIISFGDGHLEYYFF